MFLILLSRISLFNNRLGGELSFKEYQKVKLASTEELSKKILSLPVSPFLKEKEVVRICSAIKNFYQNEE